MMGFEIIPDDLDIVELGRVFGQPFYGEPMRTRSKRCKGRLAGVDWAIVEHDHDGLALYSGLGAIQKIEGFQQGDEVGASLAVGQTNPLEADLSTASYSKRNAATAKMRRICLSAN